MQIKNFSLVKNSKLLNLLILSLAVFFIAIGFYGSDPEYYTSSQINLFITINKALSVTPEFWLNITALGDIVVLLSILSLFIIKNMRIWAALFGSIPLAFVLTHANKMLFQMPRPAAIIDAGQFEVAGSVLRGYTSLPSGHTITVFTAMTVILGIFLLEKKTRNPILWSIFLVLFASLVAISRVAVGAHWPVDVLTGAVLGIISGISGIFLTYKYSSWWIWASKEKFSYIHIIMLSLFVYVLISRHQFIAIYWFSVAVAIVIIFNLIFTKYKRS
ncbi:MAG: phosphatase PAP2 family protein [Gammaproteobacteria bacterium]|nr:phosphatase PAP2 family protein [Gammaproteobacteria bacterium]